MDTYGRLLEKGLDEDAEAMDAARSASGPAAHAVAHADPRAGQVLLSKPKVIDLADRHLEEKPGGDLADERDDGAPDLVLGEAVQPKVGRSIVLADVYPVLAGGRGGAQFEVGKLGPWSAGVRGDPARRRPGCVFGGTGGVRPAGP